MIALALALSIQAATWDGIRQDGWTYRGEATSRDLIFFTRPAPQGRDRLWIRFENAASRREDFRSVRAIVEADCANGRLRSLQTTGFSNPNLEGQSVSRQSEDWFYPAPGTMHETAYDLLCSPVAE